jgi:hypothetical protein
MLLALQLSPWLTTFDINVMRLLNNITPPSEQSVRKEKEYCFILLSSLTQFTHLEAALYSSEFCLIVFICNTSSFLIMFNFNNQELHM